MKYIIIKRTNNSFKEAIIFSNTMYHNHMAGNHSCEVLSAGKIGLNGNGELYCFGESTSLDLKSDPEDIILIKQYETNKLTGKLKKRIIYGK